MKTYHVVFALLLLASMPGQAQDLAVTATFPPEGDSLVALQTTVSFTFNAPLDTTIQFDHDWPVAFFAIEPADSIQIDRIHFNEDASEVRFDVTHTDSTDFVWVLTGAVRTDSLALCNPATLNYATGPSRGPYRIEGNVSIIIPVSKRHSCHEWYDARPIAAILDGDPLVDGRLITAQVVDDQYNFSLAVPPGKYWPAAYMDGNADGRIMPDWPQRPSVFAEGAVYDMNFNGSPDSVTVEEANLEAIYLMFVGPGSSDTDAPISSIIQSLEVFPNPVASKTTISFELDQATLVIGHVYDVLGREIVSFGQEMLSPGQHRWELDTHQMPAGLYLVRLQAGNGESRQLPILVR